MNPKEDNQENEAKPDVSVDIPHGEKPASPAPTSAPPLPELEPLPQPPADTSVPTPPPSIPLAPQYEFHEREERRWPVVLMYIILAFLVAAAIVFAGRWVYQRVSNNNAKPASPTTTPQTQGQGAVPSPPAGLSPTSPEAGANQNVPVATNGQLPNNGPGDVIAIFAGTAVIVGGLHFIYNLRKKS